MRLFDPVINEAQFHKNFSSILIPERQPEREELMKWAEGFPDRDGKFVKEFQISFNSSFWEIYLYAAFKEFGLEFDWTHASPDFLLKNERLDIVVEAATANSAEGKPNEWDKFFTVEELEKISFNALNQEAIIRLSNTLLTKIKYYEKYYSKLEHVKNRPFVLAIAPFEQPHFNLQYDRPIRALLYDYYVDEEAFLENPECFPEGPPVKPLGFVEKANGAEIPLGFFNDNQLSGLSAVIFSCTATWGKVCALSKNPDVGGFINSVWATEPQGVPEKRTCPRGDYVESLTDGIQIYHNPYALRPIPADLFRRKGVVQIFPDPVAGKMLEEESTNCLHHRQVFTFCSR